MEDDDKSLVYNIHLCRICQISNNSELIKTSVETKDGKTYLDVMKYIFNDIFWVEDELPSLACNNCLKKITDIAEFKTMCLKANEQRSSINSIAKEFVDPLQLKVETEWGSEVNAQEELLKPEILLVDCSTEESETPKALNPKSKRQRAPVETKNDSAIKKVKVRNAAKAPKSKSSQCEICGEKFNQLCLLERHIYRHNGTRNYICTVCGRKYITQGDLTEHLKLHSTEYNYACDICPKKFKSCSNLTTHKKIVHTDPKNYKHLCTVCGKIFSTGQGLKEHLTRHKQVRSFVCTICSKAFVSKPDMLRHATTHSNERPFKCDLCPVEYKRKHHLSIHKTEMHGIGNYKRTKTVRKMYDCSYCGKSISLKDKFERHLRVHTGDKPYQCRRCNTKFTCKSYIKTHLKKKHDVNVDLIRDFDISDYYIVIESSKEDYKKTSVM